MTESASVWNEYAEIHYDVEGQGPCLLLIAGAGGDGDRYAAMSRKLAEKYRVIRYDRRCNARSTGDVSQPLDMAQQARDAAAVIDAAAAGKALVFGNSGGANIALRLTQDFPGKIAGLIVHEPPALPVLPDADAWLMFSDDVEAVFHESGPRAAMLKFASAMKGFSPSDSGSAVGDSASTVNLPFFLKRELHQICRYSPDFDKLRACAVPMIVTAGAASADAYYARSAQIIAKTLDAPYRLMSGHHIAFVNDPDRFAAELLDLLDELGSGDRQ